MPIEPYERLRKVFNTVEKRLRLRRRFGLSTSHTDKWFRDAEGDTATGHPNPMERVRDIIDEAFLVDPTGAGARLIARDSIEYYESLVPSNLESAQGSDVVGLVVKMAELARDLPPRRLTAKEKIEIAQKLNEIETGLERIGALVNSEQRSNVKDFAA